MASKNARLTLTRTSVKDKMLRLLDQILLTSDELRSLVNRHIGSMPASVSVSASASATNATNASNASNASNAIETEVYPPLRMPGKTRKKRTSKGPEVSLLPEAASSPLAQNIQEAIQNVKDPNPELRAQLAKITCPGGPAAFNDFRKRLAELLNQAGVSVTYDRMLEIAGPLYKVMCQNPIYAGTGRNGKPGVPFDVEQLAGLQKALEQTQSLLRLSPEIMGRIQSIANGASLNELAPLSNATMSLQKQRAALGVTKRGVTRSKPGRTIKAVPLAQLSMVGEEEEEEENSNLVMPGMNSTVAKSFTLGKRLPQQITKLQQDMNASITAIQTMRNRMNALGETFPEVKPHANNYQAAAQKELNAIQTLKNQFSTVVAEKPENKDMLKTLVKNAGITLKRTEQQLQTIGREINQAESRIRGASLLAPTATAAARTRNTQSATRKLNSVMKTAARSTNNISNLVNKTFEKTKTRKAARITTPSGAIYAPGVSVGAVKPGPSNTMTSNSSTNLNNKTVSTNLNNKTVSTVFANSNEKQVQLNYLNNSPEDQEKPYRLVIAKIPSASNLNAPKEEVFLIDSEGVLYDPEAIDEINSLNENARSSYIKGIYNKNSQKINMLG
jgi:hypothetical protein